MCLSRLLYGCCSTRPWTAVLPIRREILTAPTCRRRPLATAQSAVRTTAAVTRPARPADPPDVLESGVSGSPLVAMGPTLPRAPLAASPPPPRPPGPPQRPCCPLRLDRLEGSLRCLCAVGKATSPRAIADAATGVCARARRLTRTRRSAAALSLRPGRMESSTRTQNFAHDGR